MGPMREWALMIWASGSEQLGMATDWTPNALSGHQVAALITMVAMLGGPWLLRYLGRYSESAWPGFPIILITLGGGIYLCVAARDLLHHTPEPGLGAVATPFFVFALLEAINLLMFLGFPPSWKLVLIPIGAFAFSIAASWWHEASRQQTATLGFSPDSFAIAAVIIGVVLALKERRA